MKKIALTGNIAAGKSLVENQFQSLGVKVIDADKIAHELLNEKISELQSSFGSSIINKGSINRGKLAQIIFSNKAKKEKLERIIHPLVKEKINKFLEENPKSIASIAQLFEVDWHDDFDYTILVIAKDNLREKRLIKRNNLTKEQARLRMRVQLPQSKKIPLADFVIDNNGTKEETFRQVKEIYDKLGM